MQTAETAYTPADLRANLEHVLDEARRHLSPEEIAKELLQLAEAKRKQAEALMAEAAAYEAVAVRLEASPAAEATPEPAVPTGMFAVKR